MLENSFQHELLEAGCDEAGRGCLAGSVFAAAVILPPDFYHPLLNDSKQMSEKNKQFFYGVTREYMMEQGYDPCGNCDP